MSKVTDIANDIKSQVFEMLYFENKEVSDKEVIKISILLVALLVNNTKGSKVKRLNRLNRVDQYLKQELVEFAEEELEG